MVAQWGVPVILQEQVRGEELCVVGVGDGEGGLVGAVPMKKMLLTDKGKGWAGITVSDPELYAVAESLRAGDALARALRDRGDARREGQYHLIEVNPRFPAWCYLSAAAGVNLPRMVVAPRRGARGRPRVATTRWARCSSASRSIRWRASATFSGW